MNEPKISEFDGWRESSVGRWFFEVVLQGYADAFPIMTLTEEGEGYRVLGELYSVMPSVMDRVNSIEGGAGYIPYIVDVKPIDSADKRVAQAITFIYPNTDKYMSLSPIISTKMSDITGEVKVWA